VAKVWGYFWSSGVVVILLMHWDSDGKRVSVVDMAGGSVIRGLAVYLGSWIVSGCAE